jgi:hypothetical protein
MLEHVALCLLPVLSASPLAACASPAAPSAPVSRAPVPSAVVLGPPCLCFPLQYRGGPMIPELTVGRAGWDAARLSKETLAVALTSDDAFARAEVLRRALLSVRALDVSETKTSQAWCKTLITELETNLQREAQLAPLSRTELAPAAEVSAAQVARGRGLVTALAGVVRVEQHPAHGGLVVWHDARQAGPAALAATAAYASEARTSAPSARGHALAALSLGYAREALGQLGIERRGDGGVGMAAMAAALEPRDAAIQLVAGMIAFDGDSLACARYGRKALELGRADELVAKNLLRVLGHFYGSDTLAELEAAFEKRIARG